MKIFTTLSEWQAFRKSLPLSHDLGFVPTMGNLHQGHLSLIQQSQRDNNATVVSLFVNPHQFNQSTDFMHYPRTEEADKNLLTEAGVDYCLMPEAKAMYHDNYNYQIHERSQSLCLEGIHRPGHFTGVLTVVMKLLQLVLPKVAYLGEKDYQQYLLIRGMVDAFFMPIEIKICPTVREASGLPYSSRNNRLTSLQKQEAERFAQIFHQKKSSELLLEELVQQGLEVEYLQEYAGRRYVAVKVGDIRLIDNYEL